MTKIKKLIYVSNISSKHMNIKFCRSSIDSCHSLNIECHAVANRSLSTKEDIMEDEKKYGVVLKHIDFVRNPLHPKNIVAYKQLVELIKKEKYDYIHCNTPVGGLLGRLAAKRCGIKRVIYTAHGFHFYKGAPIINWLLYFPVEWLCAWMTDCLITINREDFDRAKRHMHAKQVRYIPGVGVDLKRFIINDDIDEIGIKGELNLSKEVNLILSVGELNKNKNHETVIRALAKLENTNIHYVIAGRGCLESYLINLARELGVDERVHLLGFRNDVEKLYSQADIFIFPSYREGLPASVMEAMAAGLPCIVSKIRGNMDLIEHGKGGFLYSPDDVDGFVEGISTIYGDKSVYTKMRDYNLDRIKEFSIDKVKKQVEEIYREILQV